MEIHEHAVDRYIERVMGLDPDRVGWHVREAARRNIGRAVTNPEHIYDEKEDEPPIHIRESVAVPVDRETVPTAYHSTSFTKKMDV